VRCFSHTRTHTRWFKYDQDYLWVNKSQFVPVMFEPPCIYYALYRSMRAPQRSYFSGKFCHKMARGIQLWVMLRWCLINFVSIKHISFEKLTVVQFPSQSFEFYKIQMFKVVLTTAPTPIISVHSHINPICFCTNCSEQFIILCSTATTVQVLTDI
jgi:hypothetical protein